MTAGRNSAAVAVLEKRATCNYSDFWGIRIAGKTNVPSTVGQLVVELDNTSTPGGTGYDLLYSKQAIWDGAFHHVALVRQATTATLYIDGVAKDSAATSATINLTNAAALVAGTSVCQGVDGTVPFKGQLDEIQLYHRALSGAEVHALSQTRKTDASSCSCQRAKLDLR